MKRKDTFIGALEEFQPKTYKVTEEEKVALWGVGFACAFL